MQRNAISTLQEWCQAQCADPLVLPQYSWKEVPGVQSGQPYFQGVCRLPLTNQVYETRTGFPSKAAAKREAARLALAGIDCGKETDRTPCDSQLENEGEREGCDCGEEMKAENMLEKVENMVEDPVEDPVAPKVIVLVDLENLPQAGKVKYPPTARVLLVLSHNHSFYGGPAGAFLEKLPKNVHLRVVRSSLKDAADHYLTWLAAMELQSYAGSSLASDGERLPPNFIVASRDVAGACTAECLLKGIHTLHLANAIKVEHVTNVRDLKESLRVNT